MTRSRPAIDVSAVLLDPERFPADAAPSWPTLFGTDRPVELEIGSGKGLFLANAAAQRPGHCFLGIELSRKYARLAAERIVKRELANVRIWPGDACRMLPRQISKASLRAIHVYFPDPWWKKRHKKRRVFTSDLVAAIARTLEPQGELHFATDVEEYFEVIQALVADEYVLETIEPPAARPPEHDLDYLTNFERKFRLEGRSIFRARYRKMKGQPEDPR
jgi:tRNA (guanine-N7-)-methyltransferase